MVGASFPGETDKSLRTVDEDRPKGQGQALVGRRIGDDKCNQFACMIQVAHSSCSHKGLTSQEVPALINLHIGGIEIKYGTCLR